MKNTVLIQAKYGICPCGQQIEIFTEIDPWTNRVQVELREETFADKKNMRFIHSNHRCGYWTGPVYPSDTVHRQADIPETVRKELHRISFKIKL